MTRALAESWGLESHSSIESPVLTTSCLRSSGVGVLTVMGMFMISSAPRSPWTAFLMMCLVTKVMQGLDPHKTQQSKKVLLKYF